MATNTVLGSTKSSITRVAIPSGGKDGQCLVKKSDASYDTGWSDTTGGVGIESLNDIAGVDTSSATDGQVLQYNETTSIWEAVDNIGGGTVDLSDYYNKTESDTLLNEKANTSDIAANYSGINHSHSDTLTDITNETLEQLSNVDLNGGGLSGQVLTRSANTWHNSFVYLDGSMADVTVTNPTTNQVLTYNGSTWVNQDAPTIDGDYTTDADVATNHYIKSEVDTLLNGKTDTGHQHSMADVTDSTWISDYTVTQTDVTDHQAALNITESQISNLGSYITGITNENIESLSNVAVTSPTTDQVLSYDGTNWINADAASGGGGGGNWLTGNNGNDYGTAPTSSGTDSLVAGMGANANGTRGTALGSYTDANGDYSTAIGNGAQATGSRSTALGQGCVASQTEVTAVGRSSEATGSKSGAFGHQAKSQGSNSLAVGHLTTASGVNSIAIGNSYTNATQTYAISIGTDTRCTHSSSTLIGRGMWSKQIGEFSWSHASFDSGLPMGSSKQPREMHLLLSKRTTDATQQEMELTNNNYYVGDSQEILSGRVRVIAQKQNNATSAAAYDIDFVWNRAATKDTCRFLGTPTVTVIHEDNAAWDCQMVNDTTNGRWSIMVTGEASTNIDWVASFTGVWLRNS